MSIKVIVPSLCLALALSTTAQASIARHAGSHPVRDHLSAHKLARGFLSPNHAARNRSASRAHDRKASVLLAIWPVYFYGCDGDGGMFDCD